MKSKSFLAGAFCLLFSTISFAQLPQKEHFNCVFKSQDLSATHSTLEMTVKSIGVTNNEGLYVVANYNSKWDKIEELEHSMPVVVRGTNPILKLSAANTDEESRFTAWDKLHLSIDLANPIQMRFEKESVTAYLAQAGFYTVQRYIEAEGICISSQK